MKRFLMTTAIVLTTAGSAFAQTADGDAQLKTVVGNYIATSPYMVGVDALTETQISDIYAEINSGDSSADIDEQVGVILQADGMEVTERPTFVVVEEVETPRDQVYQNVSMALDGTKFEGMAYTLSDEELANAYLILNDSDSTGDKLEEIEVLFDDSM